MKRILFDTSAVRSMLAGESAGLVIGRILRDLRAEHSEGFSSHISTITVQELASWGMGTKQWMQVEPTLKGPYTPVEFDYICAVKAGELQSKVLHAEWPKKPKSARVLAIDVWHRDAAIMATAIVHKLDYVIAVDGDFLQYQSHFNGKILRAVAATAPVSTVP